MNTVYVVMGHEFYSSWPVRVFRDSADAQEFANELARQYDELRKPIDADRAQAAEFGVEDVTVIADSRACDAIRASGLDPRAGGLELQWGVHEVPEGAP